MRRYNGMRFDTDQIISNIEKRQYRYIGAGTGRKVYDLENGYVAKLAMNFKGVAQNKAEFGIASGSRCRLFARVLLVSRDYSLLIMERADRVYSMSEVRQYFNVRNNKELFQLKEFRDIITYELSMAELCRPVNWGMIRNKPVIVDFGFTRDVKERYY